jgi:hypothetical protein
MGRAKLPPGPVAIQSLWRRRRVKMGAKLPPDPASTRHSCCVGGGGGGGGGKFYVGDAIFLAMFSSLV